MKIRSFYFRALSFIALLTLLSCSGNQGTRTADQADDHDYLVELYDRLHDSPVQQKFRKIAPMPFGVVFLPWKGMTEEEMREQFRLMKKTGFHNLKQTMSSPEWPTSEILRIAWEEDVIPFWYGEGGWRKITPQLLDSLGIPQDTPIEDIRRDPKMLAFQKEIIRQQLPTEQDRRERLSNADRFRHYPDPLLHPENLELFKKWVRERYETIEELNEAWNVYEVGIGGPYESWEAFMRNDNLLAYTWQGRQKGREYGRIKDVITFKAETRNKYDMERRLARKNTPDVPIRAGGEMGLFLPFAWRSTDMEGIADNMTEVGSFYPSIHFAWHFGEVQFKTARTVYMQSAFAADLFKGGWSATWESTGGPQQLSGGKGWDYADEIQFPGVTVNEGTITQQLLSYLAAGFKGAGIWCWNFRRAGWEAGEFALTNRQGDPGKRAIRAGQIAQAAERHRDEIWQAHKEPYVGVLYNWDSDAIWAAISVRGREHFKHYPMQARVGVSRALINNNIPWEHVTPADLRAGLTPRYRIIYLPGQISLEEDILEILKDYTAQGGRVVLDAPGGWYDYKGAVLYTGSGSAFEQLFGAEIADFQHTNNIPRYLEGNPLDGFILELNPTSATVPERFQTGEPAVTENRIGEGSAVILAFDASWTAFEPGNMVAEEWIRKYSMGTYKAPYSCDGAIVFRIASPEADHYFFINDDEKKTVVLDTKAYSYGSVTDAVTQQELEPGKPIELEAYSGRWLRYEKK